MTRIIRRTTVLAATLVLAACSRHSHRAAPDMDLMQASLVAAHASQRLGEHGVSGDMLQLAPREGRGWVWRHLAAIADDSDDRWDAHPATVFALAVSPDGSRLLSGSSSGQVRLWDPATHEMLREFTGHANEVHCVAFSPDGRTAASSSGDATVRLWDIESGAQRLVYKGHTTPVGSILFAPDGSFAVSSSYLRLEKAPFVEGLVKIWNPATGEDIAEIRGLGRKPISSLSMTRDGALVAAGTWDFDVHLIDVASRRVVRRLESEDFGVYRAIDWVEFSRDGSMLAAASRDRRVRVWRVADGEVLATIGPLGGAATCASFSPDGADLAIAGEDGAVRIASTADWSERAVLRGHRLGIRPIAWTPGSNSLYSGSADGTIRRWELRGVPFGRHAARDLDGLGAIEFASDDRRRLSCSFDGIVSVWDGDAGEVVARWFAHEGTCNTATFSPDGARIATCSWNGEVAVWDAVTGARTALLKHDNGVSWAEFSPDGRRLASSNGGKLDMWNIATNERVWSIDASKGRIQAIDWSPDGRYIATAPHAKTVGVFDANTGAQVLALEGHEGGVISAVFSPDSGTLATVGGFGVVRLWSIPEGRLVGTAPKDPSGGNRLAFSPDGRLLATGSARARVLDVATLRELLTLHEHPSDLWSLAWSHDGTRLATTSMDGTTVLSDSRPRPARRAAFEAARESNARMRQRIGERFASGLSAEQVAAEVAADASLSPLDRTSAQLAILRHAAPPERAEAELAARKKE